NSLSSDRVTALALDTQGTLWIGTTKGLNHLAQSATAVQREGLEGRPEPIDGSVNALYLDRQNRLWITTDDGVSTIMLGRDHRGQLHKFGATECLAETGMLSTVFQDSAGDIWLGGEKGLWRADAQAQHFFRYRHRSDDPHSLVDDTVNALFQDRTGVL